MGFKIGLVIIILILIVIAAYFFLYGGGQVQPPVPGGTEETRQTTPMQTTSTQAAEKTEAKPTTTRTPQPTTSTQITQVQEEEQIETESPTGTPQQQATNTTSKEEAESTPLESTPPVSETTTSKETPKETTTAEPQESEVQEPWKSLILPSIEYATEAMEDGFRIYFTITGNDEPPIATYYRLPTLASWSEITGGDTVPGLAFPGKGHLVMPMWMDLSFHAFHDFVGDTEASFYVAYFGTEGINDALMRDSAGTSWFLLTPNNSIILIPSMELIEIPPEYRELVNEARQPECVDMLATVDAEHLGLFDSMLAEAVLAWKDNRLTILLTEEYLGFPIDCLDTPNVTLTKSLEFPEKIVWAGEYGNQEIVWVKTESSLYAVPIISYVFQTGYRVISAERIEPHLIGEASSFAVLQGSMNPPLVFLVKDGKLSVVEVINEWEGNITVRPVNLVLDGYNMSDTIVDIYIRESGELLLGLLMENNDFDIYTIDDIEWQDEDTVVLHLGNEELYTIEPGLEVIGFSMYIRYDDDDLRKLIIDEGGMDLGTDIKVISIVALDTNDNTVIGVLDFESYTE